MELTRYNGFLQLFAESGGDGGAAASGEGSATDTAAGGDMLAGAPKKARELYARLQAEKQKDVTARSDEAQAQSKAKNTTEEERPTEAEAVPPRKATFKELIASEDYKADYERHIQRAVRDRTKRHDAEMSEVGDILSVVGQRYGLDAKSETFRSELMKALQNDDSVYEKYAEEHDMPVEEARTVVQLKQQLERANRVAEERRVAEEQSRIINALRRSAEETVAKYPDFDLETAMQDECFRQITRAFGGNTTMAYEAINHTVLVKEAERHAAAEARSAVASSVRSNLSRPTEGGLSSSNNATPSMPDFDSMNLSELRVWAAEQQRKMRR